MIPLIEQHLDEIAALCRKHKVARLDVFGSAANGNFKPGKSDVDFLVEFLPLEPGPMADSYFGLKEELEVMLATNMDLVMTRAIKNRFFLTEVMNTRKPLYVAEIAKTA